MDSTPFKVLFINDNGLNESLPITEISAVLEAHGMETDLLIQRDEGRRFWEVVDHVDPDVVVIPFDILGQIWSIRITRDFKARYPKMTIVAIGTYATLYPEVLTECDADLLCRGESEHALLELFLSMRAQGDFSTIDNLWIKGDETIARNPMRPLTRNLDAFPLPNRELYYRRYQYLRAFSTKRIIAGRGCANRCFYCYNAALQDLYRCRAGDFVRKKSPDRVLAEIEDLHRVSVLGAIYFLDDLFTDDKEWLLGFCGLYARRFDVPFVCNLTADSVDEDKVRALKQAGCRAVLMGVEAGNEALRVNVLNKIVTDDQIFRAVELYKKHGIKFLTYTMLGFPGEIQDDLFLSLALNQKLKPDYLRVTIAYPMPKTVMTEMALEKGLITREGLDGIFSRPAKEQYTTGICDSDVQFMKFVERFYYLFQFAVKLRMSRAMINMLIRIPLWIPLLKWMHYLTMLWEERGIYNITLVSGLRFFLHTGHPMNKTKNANNFIP